MKKLKYIAILLIVILLTGCEVKADNNLLLVPNDSDRNVTLLVNSKEDNSFVLPLDSKELGEPNELKKIYEKYGFKVRLEEIEFDPKDSPLKEEDIISIQAKNTITGDVISTFNAGNKLSSDYEIVITYYVECKECETNTNIDLSNSYFKITFIDVGQGDAILIECDDHYALIDGGPNSSSPLMYSFLKNKNIVFLDYVFCTHPDDDHVGGLSGALNYATLGNAYCPYSGTSEAYTDFVKYANRNNVNIQVPEIGDIYELGNSNLEVLASNIGSDNDASLVLKATFGETSFLLMGDANTSVEDYLINNKIDIKCDLLKVGHHGSKYSTGHQFLFMSEPKYAVISVGKDNTYGHPTDEVLSKLKDANVETFRTDLQGDILCVSDGKNIIINTEKNNEINTFIPYSIDNNNNNDNKKSTNNSTNNEYSYCINLNTKKFHYLWCSSVSDMKDKNKLYTNDDRDFIISQGYVPCKKCNP